MATAKGHILYVDNGIEPKRKHGDFAYWKGLVPGDTSGHAVEDSDVMTFDEIPHVANPPSGFVQNTNDPPWTSTMAAGDPLQGLSALYRGRRPAFDAQRTVAASDGRQRQDFL